MDEPIFPPPQRATLRTIAEKTGLSLSTVSLSLRGGTTLKEETRRKVAQAAAELGYVPDRAGVRLRTGKTNVLALVLDSGGGAIDFARHLIGGVGEALRDTPYHLSVTPEFTRTASIESVRHIIENRTADGVILTHTAPLDPRVRFLLERQFPFVTHGRTAFTEPHAFHDFHAEAFAEAAVNRLLARGCRNLMLLVGDDGTTNYRNITTTFSLLCAAAGVDGEVVDDKQLARSRSDDIRRFGITLARRAGRPDGIVCDGELRAMALLSGLAEGGAALGRDFWLISKQTSDILPTLFPSVDSIEEDVHAAGLELTRLLLARIAGVPARQLQTLGTPVTHWRTPPLD